MVAGIDHIRVHGKYQNGNPTPWSCDQLLQLRWGARWGLREWDTRDSFCHLPVNHTASAVCLLLLLLWDTWSPTAKKTQLGNRPGNVICASLQNALNIRGIIHTNWCYTGPLLAPGSSKIRDEDVMFCEHVTVVLRVGLLFERLQ